MEYKKIVGKDGRSKIVFDDNVAFDEGTFENIFCGVCDTYAELPRMILQVAKEASTLGNKDGLDQEVIIHHAEGIRDLRKACDKALKQLIEAGIKAGLPENYFDPDDEINYDIHLDSKTNVVTVVETIESKSDLNKLLSADMAELPEEIRKRRGY